MIAVENALAPSVDYVRGAFVSVGRVRNNGPCPSRKERTRSMAVEALADRSDPDRPSHAAPK